MKVLPFKIPKPQGAAFVFQIDEEKAFYDKLHQHEELQCSLIVEGKGTLVVGDTVNHYSKGDILIIGSHLPHVFKSDRTLSGTSKMLSLFFTKASFGNGFFDLDVFKELQPFFERSKHGFKVISQQSHLEALFLKLEQASDLEQFILLFQLMLDASKADHQSLSSFIFDRNYTDTEGHRMRNVLEFSMNHFQEPVTLEAVSDVAAMTKNAFCKFFKRRTNKSYIRFLNELRIEHACRLLLQSDEATIAGIAEASGFNNVSNFNRQFKAFKSVSPKDYKRQKKAS